MLKKAGGRASGARRGLLGPSKEELSAEKFREEVAVDLDYIKNSIGTIDLGALGEEEYMRHVEHEFLNKTNDVLERLDLSRWLPYEKIVAAFKKLDQGLDCPGIADLTERCNGVLAYQVVIAVFYGH